MNLLIAKVFPQQVTIGLQKGYQYAWKYIYKGLEYGSVGFTKELLTVKKVKQIAKKDYEELLKKQSV